MAIHPDVVIAEEIATLKRAEEQDDLKYFTNLGHVRWVLKQVAEEMNQYRCGVLASEVLEIQDRVDRLRKKISEG